jgi:hypothetical protein
MKLLKIYISITILFFLVFLGCKDTSTDSNSVQPGTLIFEKPNLVDSLVGTCSAYLIRTSIFDSIDTRNYNNLKIEFNAYTDGDLSNISLYYLNADTNYYIIVLNGINQINSTKNITVPSPKIKDYFFLRLRLFASVCTGQNYHLKIRDLKIYGVN